MDDGLLLQSAIGLQAPPQRMAGQIWNSLQDLKQKVSQELLAEEPLLHEAKEVQAEATAQSDIEIEWRYRKQLQARLLAISNAQDQLFEGEYGKCIDCHKPIHARRLEADPVVSRCLDCQQIAEGGFDML